MQVSNTGTFMKNAVVNSWNNFLIFPTINSILCSLSIMYKIKQLKEYNIFENRTLNFVCVAEDELPPVLLKVLKYLASSRKASFRVHSKSTFSNNKSSTWKSAAVHFGMSTWFATCLHTAILCPFQYYNDQILFKILGLDIHVYADHLITTY